MENKEKKI